MARVFVDVAMSLDGYIAGPNGRAGNPLGDGGLALHEWMFRTATFGERLGRGDGERSADDDLVRQVFERAGSYVLGKRMFEEGEVGWPEDAPFRAPVFVLTHTPRAPWVRKGGTTFHFVTEGIEHALEQARKAAGGRDVRISGGAETIQEYLAAGLVDEMTLHIAPRLLGGGVRLFERLAPGDAELELAQATPTPLVLHVRYTVKR